jgi:hypothetical protein
MADYCTAANIKSIGRLNLEGAEYDFALSDFATAASRWIDRYFGGPDDLFAATVADTRYFDACAVDGYALKLDKPLLSITTLTNGDGLVISSGSYRLQPRNGEYYWSIRLLTTHTGWMFSTDDSEIGVNGVWGFAATVPSPVKEAAAMLAGWIFKRYQSALQDASINFELGQVVYSEAMPKQVRALLDVYGRKQYL